MYLCIRSNIEDYDDNDYDNDQNKRRYIFLITVHDSFFLHSCQTDISGSQY